MDSAPNASTASRRFSDSNGTLSLGIDVSKATLEAALLGLADQPAGKTVSNDEEGHVRLREWL